MILHYAAVLFYTFGMYFSWPASIGLENYVNNKKTPDARKYEIKRNSFQERALNSA